MFGGLSLDFATVLVFAVAGYYHGRSVASAGCEISVDTVHRHLGKPLVGCVGCAGLLVLVLLAGMSDVDRIWRAPLWLEFATPQLIWLLILGPLAYLGAVCATVARRSADARYAKLPHAMGVLLLAFIGLHWSTHRSIANNLGRVVLEDGMVLQSSGVSCVPASAANIAAQFGIERTEREMAELLGTTVQGTSVAQTVYGMRKLSVHCRKAEFDEAAAIPVPAMLFVDHPSAGEESHAVAMTRRPENGRIEILDPLGGRRVFTEADFTAIWHGKALLFSKD